MYQEYKQNKERKKKGTKYTEYTPQLLGELKRNGSKSNHEIDKNKSLKENKGIQKDIINNYIHDT